MASSRDWGWIPGLEGSSEGECMGGVYNSVLMNGSVFVNGKKIIALSLKIKIMLQCQFVPIFCRTNTQGIVQNSGCYHVPCCRYSCIIFYSLTVFTRDCRVTIPVCLVSSSTGTQICRVWCTNSTATWSSAWTLEETTNSCSMSCATSSKQVKVEIIQFNNPVTFSSHHAGAATQTWHWQHIVLEEKSHLITTNVHTDISL